MKHFSNITNPGVTKSFDPLDEVWSSSGFFSSLPNPALRPVQSRSSFKALLKFHLLNKAYLTSPAHTDHFLLCFSDLSFSNYSQQTVSHILCPSDTNPNILISFFCYLFSASFTSIYYGSSNGLEATWGARLFLVTHSHLVQDGLDIQEASGKILVIKLRLFMHACFSCCRFQKQWMVSLKEPRVGFSCAPQKTTDSSQSCLLSHTLCAPHISHYSPDRHPNCPKPVKVRKTWEGRGAS